MKTIKVQHIDNGMFQGFGKAVYVANDAKPDGESEIQKYYGQLAIMQRSGPVQIGVCAAKNRAFVVEELEQHNETEELLVALKGDFITLAAPSGADGGPDIGKAVAIRVNQGEGVFFNTGIWHWTPYPTAEACDVLVIFKEGTPQNDFTACRLSEPVKMEL